MCKWDGLTDWRPEQGPLWVHLDRTKPGARRWLQENAGLSELTSRALLEEETRPRVFSSSDGLIAILRGINFNAGADPDDMVVLRLCVDEERLITVRYRPLMTPRDMLSELVEKRKGARSVPELFVKLTERLTERMNTVVVELDEKLDSIEEELEEGEFPSLRRQLTDVRQAAVRLRRYIGPQREALARIQIERPVWLENPQTFDDPFSDIFSSMRVRYTVRYTMSTASIQRLCQLMWIAAIEATLAPRTAQALPAYAHQTGLPCGKCHVNPAGGGPRTAFGRAFAANGHQLPDKTHRHGSHSTDGHGPGTSSGMMGGHRSGMMGGGMMGH